MPEGFAVRTVELSESRAELWMPFRLVPGGPAGMGGFFNVVGRLAGSATAGQAQTELTLIARRIETEHPSYSPDWGVPAMLVLSRTLAGLLSGVNPTDPLILMAVALFVTAVAILATYLPARRAVRVDPMVALRAE